MSVNLFTDLFVEDTEAEKRYIGYCEIASLPIKPGDHVRIPAGIKVHSMRTGETKFSGKSYKVRVDHCLSGAEYDLDGKHIIQNPQVSWAGTGGYWMRADINEVEKLDTRSRGVLDDNF